MQNEPELIIDEDGNKRWYLYGKCHREDGPAVERSNGDKYWFLNGKCHRVDGPAIEHANGNKEWYLNGRIHRTDGPAVEYSNGSKRWCLNDTEYSFEEWLEITPLSEKEKVKIRLMYAE